MARIQEEKIETKITYNLTGRLFSYLKPYKGKVFIALCLVLIITGFELLKPKLIGDAIDLFIEKDYQLYAMVNDGDITFNDQELIATDSDGYDKYAVIYSENEKYYYEENLSYDQALSLKKNHPITDAKPINSGDLKVLRTNDINGIKLIAFIYIVVLICNFLCNFYQSYNLQKMGQDIIYNIRTELFHHINNLPMKFFDTHPIGRIVTRITNDVESLNEMYSKILIRLFQSSIKIMGLIVVMLMINYELALFSFVMVPIIVILTLVFKNISRKVHRVIRTRISILNTFLSENISGMRLIQIFANEQLKYNEFKEKNTKLYQANLKRMYINATFRPLIYFISQIGLAILLYKGSVEVLAGALSIGTIYIFINYMSSLYEPIQDMAEQLSVLQNAFASAEKIFSLLDETNNILEKDKPVILDKIEGNIEFKHVWFAYEQDEYVLKDVSFKINKGEKVAFVGATGAGKSSILNLINRYYDIQKGQILIDGVDIKDLSIKQLRSALGIVLQDVFIFNGSIMDNIRLLNEEISEQRVIECAKITNADKFINNLPNTYHEIMTERGSTLSMGQRQLLSFARTLAAGPKILIMDEATANIDSDTELLIQDALEKMMKDKTTIMVAHRLSTIQHADKIVVMHKGEIKEMGNHQELLAKNGMYKKLYELQLYAN